MKNFYKKLRLQKTRGKNGRPFSIGRLGKELGFSVSCLSKIERNIHRPTLEVVIAYQKYFHVAYENLIEPIFQDYQKKQSGKE